VYKVVKLPYKARNFQNGPPNLPASAGPRMSNSGYSYSSRARTPSPTRVNRPYLPSISASLHDHPLPSPMTTLPAPNRYDYDPLGHPGSHFHQSSLYGQAPTSYGRQYPSECRFLSFLHHPHPLNSDRPQPICTLPTTLCHSLRLQGSRGTLSNLLLSARRERTQTLFSITRESILMAVQALQNNGWTIIHIP
jgi:hypothetical protein